MMAIQSCISLIKLFALKEHLCKLLISKRGLYDKGIFFGNSNPFFKKFTGGLEISFSRIVHSVKGLEVAHSNNILPVFKQGTCLFQIRKCLVTMPVFQ